MAKNKPYNKVVYGRSGGLGWLTLTYGMIFFFQLLHNIKWQNYILNFLVLLFTIFHIFTKKKWKVFCNISQAAHSCLKVVIFEIVLRNDYSYAVVCCMSENELQQSVCWDPPVVPLRSSQAPGAWFLLLLPVVVLIKCVQNYFSK